MLIFPVCHFGGKAPLLEYGSFLQQSTGSTSPVFSSMTLGTPSSTRNVVACVLGFGPPSGVATAVAIGGISATIDVNTRNALGVCLTIAHANVPTGTSGNVQVTYPSTTSNSGAYCWTYSIDGMKNYIPQTISDTASPFNKSITCDANSAIIFIGDWYQSGGSPTGLWSGTVGIIEDNQRGPLGSSGIGSVASLLNSTAITSNTIIWTPNNTNAAMMGGVIFT